MILPWHLYGLIFWNSYNYLSAHNTTTQLLDYLQRCKNYQTLHLFVFSKSRDNFWSFRIMRRLFISSLNYNTIFRLFRLWNTHSFLFQIMRKFVSSFQIMRRLFLFQTTRYFLAFFRLRYAHFFFTRCLLLYQNTRNAVFPLQITGEFSI